MGFCQTATNILKSALAVPKGELYPLAQKRMRELRNSLIAVGDPIAAYNPYLVRLPALPPLADQCWDKKNQLRANCSKR
jgi:uncharacterized protein (UPF0218 family)